MCKPKPGSSSQGCFQIPAAWQDFFLYPSAVHHPSPACRPLQPTGHPFCGLSRARTASCFPCNALLRGKVNSEAEDPQYQPPWKRNQPISSNNFYVETGAYWESLVFCSLCWVTLWFWGSWNHPRNSWGCPKKSLTYCAEDQNHLWLWVINNHLRRYRKQRC